MSAIGQSEDEFLREPSEKDEVWVRHRESGHLFKFWIASGGLATSGIETNRASHVDPASLVPSAIKAAHQYIPKEAPRTLSRQTTRRPQKRQATWDLTVGRDSTPQSPTPRRARLTRKARTQVGKALLKNQVQIALSIESLLVLVDDKLALLRDQHPNSDEAREGRVNAILHHEKLRRDLITFRKATFEFLANTNAGEKPVLAAAASFEETIKVGNKFLDVGLFLLGASICALLGSDPTLAALVTGALVGKDHVVKAVKNWASKKSSFIPGSRTARR